MTFLTTRPPAFIASPRPVTAWTPRKWSRAPPALMRLEPARLQANTPPMLAAPAREPSSGPRSGGSKASCWSFSASAVSISASGVPGPALITSSAGSYMVMPDSAETSSSCAACTGRPSVRFEPRPTTSSGASSATAHATASASCAASPGLSTSAMPVTGS